MVGDSHAMGVAAHQILQHIFGATEGTFQVDHPVLSKQRPQPGGKDLGLSEEFQISLEAELAVLEGLLERIDELAAKDFTQHPCPGDNESAGVNYSHRSPKGNRHMRRVLNQTANAAARTKGSIFELVYRRSVPRLGHNQAIGAIAHRHCRLIWLILHQGVRYEERGPAVTKQSKQKRTTRMIRQLRSLGYRIEAPNPQHSQAQSQ